MTKRRNKRQGEGRPTSDRFGLYIGTPDSASGEVENSLAYYMADSEEEKDFLESLIEENK